MEFWSRLICPHCKQANLRLSTDAKAPTGGMPEYGYLVCDHCGRLAPIAEQILDMAAYEPSSNLTLAGQSNDIPPTPQLYERIWRRRALTLLTGESYPVERELALLNEWIQPRTGDYVVDLGTSTGLYARGITTHVGTTTFAVDLAWGMLKEAKKYIAREKRQGIVLMRAAAENLPFHDESMDAVVVGGSLNEMKGFDAPLRETYRVTRRGGRMFVMSLSKATTPPGRLLQGLAGMSGIRFPTVNEFNARTDAAGWKTTDQELKGIVLFSLLRKQD